MPRIAIAVADFDAAVDTFRTRLGMPVIDISEIEAVAHLGARIAMCTPPGGSNIEIMSPSEPEAPLAQSLQGLLARRGEGLFAMMMEAPDPDAEADDISAHGLRVLPLMPGAWGRDIHPSSTHGVLVRVYPDDSFTGSAPASDGDLGLSGIRRVTVLVRDLEQACRTYRDGLGLDVVALEEHLATGLRHAVVRPPKGGVIDLVSAVDSEQPAAAEALDVLDARGEGMWELTLEAPKLEGIAEELTARGLSVDRDPRGRSLLLDPAQVFGVRLRIEPPRDPVAAL